MTMTLTHYWRLVDQMARMSLKADASRYFFNYFWWVLEPLLYVAVFYVVFDVLLNSGRADFIVFLMCGKLSFVWFSKSVVHASRSIRGGKGLISKVDLPKALFPLATIQECLYKQSAVFALLFVFLLWNGYHITATWLWLIPLILVNYLLIVAASFIAAFLVCVAFDFAMVVSLAMVFLLFASGIFWDVRSVSDPELMQAVLTLNPIAFLVDAYRQILMFATPPNLMHLFLLGLFALLLAAGMLLVLRRTSQYLALKAITA